MRFVQIYDVIANKPLVAQPVDHSVYVKAHCANCGAEITATYNRTDDTFFAWYHTGERAARPGSEFCAARF